MKKELFLHGLKDGVPICLGYFSVSIAYGMAAVAAGLTFWQAVCISATNLTSAGQFAGTRLLGIHAGFVELAITMLVINSRYFLMALSLSQKVDPQMSFLDRLLVSYGITDEIFACEIGQKGMLKAIYIFGLILISAAGWVAGTACGALASSLLPLEMAGNLSIALYAMFIAIFIPASRDHKNVAITVILSALLSCAFGWIDWLSWLSQGYAIVLITIIVSALMALLFPIEEEEHE